MDLWPVELPDVRKVGHDLLAARKPRELRLQQRGIEYGLVHRDRDERLPAQPAGLRAADRFHRTELSVRLLRRTRVVPAARQPHDRLPREPTRPTGTVFRRGTEPVDDYRLQRRRSDRRSERTR